MRFGTVRILSSQSMSADLVTPGINTQQDWAYAFQASWTGSALGTFKLQGSCDEVPTMLSGSASSIRVVNYTDISGTSNSTTSFASASAGSIIWTVSYPGYNWVRLAFSAASGSGNLTLNYSSKGI